MSSDVLRRDTARSLIKNIFIPRLFFGAQLALGMRKEVGAINTENEHEERFRIQPRRRNLV